MDENKRKSSRSFELEKGEKRSFDLNKTSARKFDLAKESDEVGLEELKRELLADGKIDAEEVNKLREVLYADGKIDQEEADFLFELNDAVSGKQNDSSWKAFFVEAITDYLLNDEKSPGVIDEEEGKWLEAKINNDGNFDTVERALVASLCRKSKSMPQSLNAILSMVASRFKLEKDEVPAEEASAAADALAETKAKAIGFNIKKDDNEIDLAQLKKEVLADGKIDKEEVELLRKALYADGKIDEEEANFLFEINDAVSGKKNDPAWNQFFVEAISDYLLNDEKSPGVIDEEEGKWLIEKIGADGQVDGIEKQLLINLKKRAKSMPSSILSLIGSDENRPKPQISDDNNTCPDKKSKKWLWVVLAFVVAAAIAFFCMKSCKTNDEEQSVNQAATGLTINNDEQASVGEGNVIDSTHQEKNLSDSESDEYLNDENSSDVGNVTTSAEEAETQPNNGQKSDVQTPSNKQDIPAEPVKKEESSTPALQQKIGNSSFEEIALDVIRGNYGNGEERKQKLGNAYRQIQDIVNDMYRKGLVN